MESCICIQKNTTPQLVGWFGAAGRWIGAVGRWVGGYWYIGGLGAVGRWVWGNW